MSYSTTSSNLGALSYGVLKEQEFCFRSKLASAATSNGPKTIADSKYTKNLSAYSTNAAATCRSRAYSLPNSQKQPPAFLHDALEHDLTHSFRSSHQKHLFTIREEYSHSSSNSNLQSSDHNVSSDLPNYPYLCSTSHNFVKQQQASFITGDPHSDRLAEFVSKMVYLIFWRGSDSFIDILNGSSSTSFSDIPELGAVSTYCPDTDFIFYTKYLLQTMQVSCSTALLSLFYLHLLRPRVKHLFVPGTFNDPSMPPTPCSSSKYQYRRDPRLEYRLFTVALILSNKYLDDNSYSNKAWSEITGLDLRKINVMELEFMKYIDYTLLVKERDYILWVRWLESFIRTVMDHVSSQSTVYFNPIQENRCYQTRRGSISQTQRSSAYSTPSKNTRFYQNNSSINHSNSNDIYLPTPKTAKKIGEFSISNDPFLVSPLPLGQQQPQTRFPPRPPSYLTRQGRRMSLPHTQDFESTNMPQQFYFNQQKQTWRPT